MTMQDRLKFRVYHKPTNKIYNVYGFNDDFVFIDTLDTCEPFFREDCILLQCTGLKDKNGKLIYEGDIVYYEKCTNFGLGGYRYARVFWWDKVQGFAIETNYGDYYGLQDFDIEIVGNIHENSDLLENKDE